MDNVEIDGLKFRAHKGVLKELVFQGYDLKKELEALEKYGIENVCICRYDSKDRINDLDFLKDYPFIKGVTLSPDDANFNIDGLYSLTNLERLLAGKHKIDFMAFPHLKVLDTRYPRPCEFPDEIHTLYLWYSKFKGKGLSSVRFPKAIKLLDITWSDLDDLTGMPSGLENFTIAYTRKLSSLAGLENSSSSLNRVMLDHCPNLRDYSSLYECHNLSSLVIGDCREMPGIGFVNGMKDLRHFVFDGTVVRDHDLSPLKGLPFVSFTNNKEYNYRLKDFNHVM